MLRRGCTNREMRFYVFVGYRNAPANFGGAMYCWVVPCP